MSSPEDSSVNPSNPEILRLQQELLDARREIADLKQKNLDEQTAYQDIQREYKSSKYLLQLVMDTLPQSIFWKDLDSVYLGCNRQFLNDAGFGSPNQVVGKSDYDMPWTTAESEFYISCDRRVMNNNQAEYGIIEPQLDANGNNKWLETNKAPLLDPEGNVIGILGTYQDITQRKEADFALQKLNEKLELQTEQLTATLRQLETSQLHIIQQEKMSALGNLVAGVAHEINNPVGFLNGNLAPAKEYVADLFELLGKYREVFPEPGADIQGLIDKIELDYVQEDLPKLLKSMGVGIGRICNISNSLRIFSRADTKQQVSFDVHTGLDSSLMILAHRLKANGDRPEIVVVKKYGQLPLIQCFAGQLNQVFMNLLANAIDSLEENSSGQSFADIEALNNQITISTDIDSEGKWAAICIADNGVGMDADTQMKIFDSSFTTKAVGKGTGLGMAIARQIIEEKHGGKIEVKSTVGQGTTMIINLPVAGI
ncbi:MAG: PAS domain-containing protein [Limnothrix sp. RL_2_0]|nr:PAS domain-containing protein [Limnothrix sp. RL_2_0]